VGGESPLYRFLMEACYKKQTLREREKNLVRDWRRSRIRMFKRKLQVYLGGGRVVGGVYRKGMPGGGRRKNGSKPKSSTLEPSRVREKEKGLLLKGKL